MQRRFVLSHVVVGAVLFFLTPALLVSGEWGRGVAPIIALLGCAAVGLALLLVKTGKPIVLRVVSVAVTTLALGLLVWFLGGVSTVWTALLFVPMLEASHVRSALLDRVAGMFVLGVGACLTMAAPVWPAAFWALLFVIVHSQINRTRKDFCAAQSRANQTVEEQNSLLKTLERTAVTVDDDGRVARLAGPCFDFDKNLPLIEAVHQDDRALFSDVLNGRQSSANVRFSGSEGEASQFKVTSYHSADVAVRVLSLEKCSAPTVSLCESTYAERQLLATMSHEMRTPLNAIIGFSDVLEKGVLGTALPDQEQEYVRLIRESGEHLLDIVKATLDASRLEAGKYELALSNFDFSKIVDSTYHMLLPVADEAGVSLICDTQGQRFPIEADERACRQTLINLLGNAVKFTPAGGHVTVKLRADSDALCLTVSDTGIGIASENIAQLGQPYLQLEPGTSRALAGSGLGLSVVKGFVELHGGTLSISSALGQGTDVAVTLPLRPSLALSRARNRRAGRIVPATAPPKTRSTVSAPNSATVSVSSLA